MRVVLLHNPRSGRARGGPIVAEAHARLGEAGFEVVSLALGDTRLQSIDHLTEQVRGARALVIAGGDGSVHYAAPAAIGADVPLYHLPLGTENLFARETGTMSGGIDTLVRSIRAGQTRTIDVGQCNGRTFVLMASVGFDADVVGRVAAARVAGVTRLDYVRHAIGEFGRFEPPTFDVVADGRPLATHQAGLLFIANSPHYAARLNPCVDARIDDGLLDVLFVPCRNRVELIAAASAIALGTHESRADVVTVRAGQIQIASTGTGIAHQLDGEAVSPRPDPLSLSIRVLPSRLRVIVASTSS